MENAWKWRSNDDDDDDGTTVLPVCRNHAWFSRHELSLYYRTFPTIVEPRPLMHEIACHGFLSVGRYVFATDISKIIVSINAHRRALRVDEPVASSLRETWSLYGDGNGKFVRLSTPGQDRTDYRPVDSIRLIFAFGDYDMLNCEDGYVLNDRSAVRATTLFRKKIILSYKNVGNSGGGGNNVTSAAATDAAARRHRAGCGFKFVARMTVECERDNGARLFVGTLYANAPVGIPCGNDVRVYRRNCRRTGYYTYDVFLVWNASYVQARDESCGSYGPVATKRESADDGAGGRNVAAAKNERLLYEESEYDATRCPVARASLEVFPRYLLVAMESAPGKQTLKLQNSFGQKGMAHYADLSDLITDRNEPVDVVSSMYSFVGRSACGQLLEQRADGVRRVYSRSTGRYVGVGGVGYFFVSNDSPHNQFIYHTKHAGSNPMRMCKLTYDALLENAASSLAFVKGCDFESSISNPYAGVPRTVRNALECYGVHRRAIELDSQRNTGLRKRTYDVAVLRRLLARDDESVKNRAETKRRKK